MIPRGLRNANPGNIRRTRTLWRGEAAQQNDPEFVTFEAPEWGLRAMAKILLTYERSGYDTVRKIVRRWAPPSENDTEAYVRAVCAAAGVAPDAPIEVSRPANMAALLKAIVRHENGRQPYSDETIARALDLAGLTAA